MREEYRQGERLLALQSAQEHLAARRRLCRHQRLSTNQPIHTDETGRRLDPCVVPASSPPPPITLPPHLGWESQPLTQLLRRQTPSLNTPPPSTPPAPSTPPTPDKPTHDARLTLYPDLALSMLRQSQVAAGRIWLLLRHLDQAGRGWLSLAEARQQLTSTTGTWRVCGWRQLRNLLTQGDDIFWQRQNERIWLRSVPRVAAALGVAALTSPAVLLPAKHLRGDIGKVRAHFYASFHSSRGKTTRDGRIQAAPIARITLEKLSQTTRQTQRRYEKSAGIRPQTNIAVGAPPTPTTTQARASQHGHALFHFRDHRGQMGQAGQTYLAWQLPNSYIGPHAQRAPGQRRRLNRQLAVLLHEGMTGNDKTQAGKKRERRCQRFFRDGSQAAHGYNRAPTQDVYWANQRPHRSSATYWHVLAGQQPDQA